MTTIGVAVAVPEPWGSELQEYRRTLGDHSAAGIPTHITLLPPIEIDAERFESVTTHLADAASGHPPFAVHLRGTGTFRPISPVVFVAVADGISACEQLAWAIRSGPLGTALSFPYHPHVTVAHHLDDAAMDKAFDELSDFECEFPVDLFSVYVHDLESGWVAARDIALDG
ncbi:MAG: 2'-5' RNA ligase family protein [Nocardioidaceae bacterium]